MLFTQPVVPTGVTLFLISIVLSRDYLRYCNDQTGYRQDQ